MDRRTLLSSILGLTAFMKGNDSFAQFSLDNPYASDFKSVTGDIARAPKDLLNVGFIWGESFSVPNEYSSGLINLKEALKKWAKIEVSINPRVILGSDDIFNYPVLISSSAAGFNLSNNEMAYLLAYFLNGGFVIFDSIISENTDNSKVDGAFRQITNDVLGYKARIERLPKTHELFTIVNDFSDGPPINNTIKPRYYIDGIFVNDRLAGIISTQGYLWAWSNSDNLSRNIPQLKFGVNMVVYAMNEPESLLYRENKVR